MEIFVATFASALAGFVDSIVGGGGLIFLPTLFALYPPANPADLLGTNKSACVWGTSFAAWQYSQRVRMAWAVLLPAAGLSMAGAFMGAWWVTLISPDFLRKLLPFVLGAVLLYTLWRKDMGRHHAPRLSGKAELIVIGAIGLVIGFYDGFFGPGTGSFFVFLLVRWLGYDFLNASAVAKLLNLSSNAAALVLFAIKGHVWWHLALPLALANIAGSLLGTRMALQYGAGFVRVMFLLVVSALICKTAFDAYVR
ncbi:MAG: TSUP family transporter [Burkholderiales bacterium]|jgi:uncharacterized membrane protein YfcA|nr:TSUP family transporter [Burkholderiales bacterium]